MDAGSGNCSIVLNIEIVFNVTMNTVLPPLAFDENFLVNPLRQYFIDTCQNAAMIRSQKSL